MVIQYFFAGMSAASEPFRKGGEDGATHDAEGDGGRAANAFGTVNDIHAVQIPCSGILGSPVEIRGIAVCGVHIVSSLDELLRSLPGAFVYRGE